MFLVLIISLEFFIFFLLELILKFLVFYLNWFFFTKVIYDNLSLFIIKLISQMINIIYKKMTDIDIIDSDENKQNFLNLLVKEKSNSKLYNNNFLEKFLYNSEKKNLFEKKENLGIKIFLLKNIL